MDRAGTLEEINEKHLAPWSEVCIKDSIFNTILSPFLSQEVLIHKHLHLSNEKLKSFGYQLIHPVIKKGHIEEMIKDWIDLKLFPRSLGLKM